MFAHLVTAAQGLFTRPESDDARADPADASAATNSNMVPSTGRGLVETKLVGERQEANDVAKHGKRKAQPANKEKNDDKQSKRRKRNSLQEDSTMDEPLTKSAVNGNPAHMSTVAAPRKHLRFDSEEPAGSEETQLEEAPQDVSREDEDEDEESDDDAPETVDNSAQLLKVKEQAKKQEKARQLEEQLRKEKRRRLDERRKLQAKSSKKDLPSTSDDLLSESTTTLQGSTTHDARRRALPALLPDEILNAEPVLRPPTPPAEDAFAGPKKSTKLKFLDKTEKAPKDVQVGDVTIRVLDAPSTKQKSTPALAPKASKSGRNVKENWLKRERSTAKVNGMRRTAGGPSGFKRK